MKQKLVTFKSLLVAALLGVGVNGAWADYTTIYQRNSTVDDTNEWSAIDVTDWGSVTNLAYTSAAGFGFNSTADGEATYTLSPTANAKVKYVVEWTFASTSSGDTQKPYSYLRLGSLVIRVGDRGQNNCISFSTDGGSNYSDEVSTKNTAKWVRDGKTVTVTAILNSANKTVESLSLSFDGVTYTQENLASTSITNVSIIGVKTIHVYSTWYSKSLIKSIIVSEEEQEVTEADYTINYQLSGTTVKTVAGTSVVDAVITAETVIDGTEEGYVGNHYLITAAEAPSMTLIAAAASNVLNVPVRAPYTATLNVTRTIGGVAETPVVTNFTETDAKVCSWGYTYPMYVKKDDVYYVADETASFGESGNFTDGQTINKTVAYTNPDYSVVYYAEPNEVAGTNTSYSNGNVGYIKGGVVYSSNDVIRLGRLAAGTYRLITNVTGDAVRNVVVGDYTAGTESFPTALVTITTTGAKDENFTVDGTQLICVSGKDQGSGKFNQSATLDYILVKASTQKKSISAAGWATYCSPYALDFSSAIDNLDAAYIVTGGAGGVLTKEAVTTTVPANTGLLLKGSAGTVNIPVVASSSTDVSANKLVGVTVATEKAQNTAYVLMNDATNGLGFYLNSNETAFTVGANTAYLPAKFDGSGARGFFLLDGSDATGIGTALMNKEAMNSEVYNLQGQRVAAPTKGLYIVNGKKAIVK